MINLSIGIMTGSVFGFMLCGLISSEKIVNLQIEIHNLRKNLFNKIENDFDESEVK